MGAELTPADLQRAKYYGLSRAELVELLIKRDKEIRGLK